MENEDTDDDDYEDITSIDNELDEFSDTREHEINKMHKRLKEAKNERLYSRMIPMPIANRQATAETKEEQIFVYETLQDVHEIARLFRRDRIQWNNIEYRLEVVIKQLSRRLEMLQRINKLGRSKE
jgi:hypothetical protein